MQPLECTGSISDRLLIHLTGKFLIKPDRQPSCRELKIVRAVLVCRKFLSEKNTQASYSLNSEIILSAHVEGSGAMLMPGLAYENSSTQHLSNARGWSHKVCQQGRRSWFLVFPVNDVS